MPTRAADPQQQRVAADQNLVGRWARGSGGAARAVGGASCLTLHVMSPTSLLYSNAILLLVPFVLPHHNKRCASRYPTLVFSAIKTDDSRRLQSTTGTATAAPAAILLLLFSAGVPAFLASTGGSISIFRHETGNRRKQTRTRQSYPVSVAPGCCCADDLHQHPVLNIDGGP